MTNPTAPAFEIVLSEEQLQNLGRFTAIWSQIDHMLFQVLAITSRIQPKSLLALIEGTTTGQRLNMLRRLIPEMQSKAAQEKAGNVCTALGSLIDKRNHLLHGVWGLRWDLKKDTLRPACHYDRNTESPIYAKQLDELCERAAKLSIRVMELLQILQPTFFSKPGPIPHRFIFADGPPPNRPAPKWQPPQPRQSAPQNPSSDPAK